MNRRLTGNRKVQAPPQKYRSQIMNICQAAAVSECPAPDARHTFRDRYVRHRATFGKSIAWNSCRPAELIVTATTNGARTLQSSTVIKSHIADTRHALRDRHARQAAAAGKGATPDARHTIRDCDACQTAAVVKRHAADARHTIRDRYARQTAAVGKGTAGNTRRPAKLIVIATPDRASRFQAVAVVKRHVTDARHASRKRHARQTAAVGKGTTPDARHAIRDVHARQTAAVVKGIFPDARHAVFQNNCFDTTPV